MNNVVKIYPLVAKSISTQIRDWNKGLESIAHCTSYVVSWVKAEQIAARTEKVA